MLGVLNRCLQRAPRTTRLRLETLEDRVVPVSPAGAETLPVPYLGNVSMQVNYITDRDIQLTGTLSDTSTPAGQTISIGGKATGSATTDANGNFSITLEASGLGDVTATAATMYTNTATVELTDEAPVITGFSALEQPGRLWLLEGDVTYARAYTSMTVRFGGMPEALQNVTATVNGDNGVFSLAIYLSGTADDNGTVWVEAVSPWGLVSEKAHDIIHQTGT